MNILEAFKDSFNSLVHPAEEARKEREGMGNAAMLIFISSLIPAIIISLKVVVAIILLSSFSSIENGTNTSPDLITGFLIMLMLVLTAAVTIWLLTGFATWLSGRILGSKSSYSKITAALAYPIAAIFIIGGLLSMLGASIIKVLLAIYTPYVLYVYFRENMQLSSKRAVVAVILFGVMTIILFLIIFGFIGAVLMASTASTVGSNLYT